MGSTCKAATEVPLCSCHISANRKKEHLALLDMLMQREHACCPDNENMLVLLAENIDKWQQ